MERSPKINEAVYIFVGGGASGMSIVKGKISGVRAVSTAFAKWLFQVETPLGCYERFALDMFESVEEITKEIKNYVVE